MIVFGENQKILIWFFVDPKTDKTKPTLTLASIRSYIITVNNVDIVQNRYIKSEDIFIGI